MLVAIGFYFCKPLIGLVVIPSFTSRAVRLTTRLKAVLPS
jgi:hypothetical protein